MQVILYMSFPFGLLNVLHVFLFYKSRIIDDLNDAEVFIAIIDCNSKLALLHFPIYYFKSFVCLNLLLFEELVMFTFLYILLNRRA